MKYALIAVIITMLFAVQAAFAAESAYDIAADLIDASELPKTVKKAPKVEPKIEIMDEEGSAVADEDVAVVADDSADVGPEAVSSKMDEVSSEESPASEDERQPAAAASEETMIAEAPGSIDFDMATINMIPDALPAPKTNFSEIAKNK